jgi:hypothetical protein
MGVVNKLRTFLVIVLAFMKSRVAGICLILASSFLISLSISGRQATRAAGPERLSDTRFWELSAALSEPDGLFRSDNLVSNEVTLQYVIPELLKTPGQGGVYIGVGPEQNFTYIAALKPAMAFIIDIRHGNLDVHLLYKALFELSGDRADFVSALFSRPRPTGLGPQSSTSEIFKAYADVPADKGLFDKNLKAIENHLKTTHGFPLSMGDIDGITWALSNFYRYGPSINYSSSSTATAPAIIGATDVVAPTQFLGGTYADLMMAHDGNGEHRSYLATEQNFAFLKDMETRNMIVPVVGDFAGQKSIREIGKYLSGIHATVAAFYVSNVETYLDREGKTSSFLGNVKALPLDASSVFIRANGRASNAVSVPGGRLGSELANILKWIELSK